MKEHCQSPAFVTSKEILLRLFSCTVRTCYGIWGQEEKGTTEDEMAGWHHWHDGHESEWTLGIGDGQGSLACCDSWGCKESDTTERLNWTELRFAKLTWVLALLSNSHCTALKVKVKLKVAQFCPTLCNPVDYIVHGVLQVRILEWVVFPFSGIEARPHCRWVLFHLSYKGSQEYWRC